MTTEPTHLPHELAEQLRDIAPAEILIFTADGCPHCSEAVRAAKTLAATSDRVRAAIIDARQPSQLAAQFNVQAVPTVVVDRELAITRVVPAEELARIVLERGTTAHQQRIFSSHLDASNFDAAARLMADSDGGSACFAHAWRNSTMNTRMALMLVAESLLEANGSALGDIVPELIAALDTDDPALRGDTADLLGQIGHPSAREPLEGLLDDRNPDVAQIAKEALEGMGE